jgi:ectoine hydroxylase
VVFYAGRVRATSKAVLSDAQRTAYREQGWLAVPALVDAGWLERLRAVTAEFVEQSRALTESNVVFDLDTGHSAAEPRLRRLSSPTDLHPTFWEFASTSAIVDVVVDLIGPDVKFHHSKLNFKAPRGGEEVKWHQDIQFLVKPSPHGEELIRGEPARWARHDPRPCLMPPSGPYRPIFAVQQRER